MTEQEIRDLVAAEVHDALDELERRWEEEERRARPWTIVARILVWAALILLAAQFIVARGGL